MGLGMKENLFSPSKNTELKSSRHMVKSLISLEENISSPLSMIRDLHMMVNVGDDLSNPAK